jgi:hypothetical protein
VWFHHYRYFRRYGLQDTFTVALNSVLLFVVLFYVYPLKFVFTMLVGQLTGGFTVGGPSVVESMISREEVPTLMAIYGVGFSAVFGIFALLCWRAHSRREQLQLTEVEVLVTQQSLFENGGMGAIGLLSVLMALMMPTNAAGLSGFVYFLIPVYITATGVHFGRKIREAKQKAKAAPAAR